MGTRRRPGSSPRLHLHTRARDVAGSTGTVRGPHSTGIAFSGGQQPARSTLLLGAGGPALAGDALDLPSEATGEGSSR